jgi:hypothetical protein
MMLIRNASALLVPGRRTAMAMASLLLATTVFVPTMELYCRNSSEFTFRLTHILPGVLLGWSALFLLSLAVQWPCRHQRFFPLLNVLVISLAFVIWIQNLFHTRLLQVPNTVLPEYSGQILPIMLFGLLLVFLPVALVVWQRRWFAANAVKVSLIAVVTQAAPLGYSFLTNSRGDYTHYDFTVSEKNKFVFGRKNNVLVIVVDSMGEALFKETLNDFPELRESLKDFTCFDRMVSPIPHTTFAVPAMLTGIAFPEKNAAELGAAHADYINTACHDQRSLFSELGRAGYVREGYPYVLQTIAYSPELLENAVDRQSHSRSWQAFIDIWLANITPLILQPLLGHPYLAMTDRFVTPGEETLRHLFQNHDVNNYHRLLVEARVGEQDQVFKYLHLQGAHVPIATDENLMATFDTSNARQLRGSLRIVEAILDRLHLFGLYDQSLIVITGDHSERYTPEVVTLIKRPGDVAAKIRFNALPCQLTDIAPTVLAGLGLRPREESLFSRPPVASEGVRDLPPVRHWQTASWRPMFPSPKLEAPVVPLETSFQFQNDVLFLTRKERNGNDPAAFRCRLYNMTDQTTLATPETPLINPQKGERYQINFPELQDGIYLLFLDERFPDLSANMPAEITTDDQQAGNTEAQAQDNGGAIYYESTCFLRFLKVAEKTISLHEKYPDLEPAPLLPGQTIPLHPMTAIPQIDFSADCRQSPSGLRVGELSVLTVFLQPTETTLRLQLQTQIVCHNDLILQILHGDRVLTTFNYSPKEPGLKTITVPVPPELTRPGEIDIHFRFASRYKNRARRQPVPVYLKNITLTSQS